MTHTMSQHLVSVVQLTHSPDAADRQPGPTYCATVERAISVLQLRGDWESEGRLARTAADQLKALHSTARQCRTAQHSTP